MIDIGEYHANIIDVIKRRGFSCVYLISRSTAGTPTKIGIACDIYHRLLSLQVSTWERIDVQYILWFPGRAASQRIETELHKKYERHKIIGEWFDIHYSKVIDDVEPLARSLYPSIILSSHSEMIEYARKKIDGKYDEALARFGFK